MVVVDGLELGSVPVVVMMVVVVVVVGGYRWYCATNTMDSHLIIAVIVGTNINNILVSDIASIASI